jgi:TetR/AcrR family transcriptional repressor of mexJK operon
MSPTPKPGRPAGSVSAAISEAILSTATDLFLTQGFERVSMEAVAAGAGVPKSTLYKRFSDKRALLRAVLEVRRARWSEQSSRSDWDAIDDLRERLRTYAEMALGWAGSPEVRAFAALVAAAWSLPEEASDRQAFMGFDVLLDVIERDIREYGPRLGIAPRDPCRTAELFMAFLTGLSEMRGSKGRLTDAEVKSFSASAVDIFFRGSESW